MLGIRLTRLARNWVAGVLLACVYGALVLAEPAADQSVRFNIPSQSADRALTMFAQQANITLVFPFDRASGVRANRLVGTYSVNEGLQRLLAGTGLLGTATEDGQLTVEAPAESGDSSTMKPRTLGFFAFVLGLGSSSASAQTGEAERASARLDEIVVTARKRDESLTDIPVAVSAFSADRLSALGVTDLQSLSSFSPGLSVVNQGATFGGRLVSGIRFRGMNPTVFTPSTQVGALFVDGIFFLGGAQSIGFDDIERVEVIRGPQAAYFGRSTFGGAINYITRDPASEFSGQFGADYSPSYGNSGFSAALEGPIAGERVRGRLSASVREKGAQYTATDGGDLGREQTQTISGMLLLEPVDRLSIRLRATFAEDDDSAPTSSLVSYSRVGNCPPGTPIQYRNAAGETVNGALTLNFHCGALPYRGVRISSNTTFPGPFPDANLPMDPREVLVDNSFGSQRLADAPRLDRFGLVRRMERYAALFDYQASDALTVAGALAYNRQRSNAIRDGDYSDTESVYIAAPADFEDYSGEMRLSYDNGSRLRGLVGVNYYRQETIQGFANAVEATYGFRIPATGPLFRPHPLQNPATDDKIKTTGVFAAVDFDLLESLTLTLEGRYQVDEVTRFSGSELVGFTEEPVYKSKEFLPRVIASWRPWQDGTVYLQYARGTLPGDNTNLAAFRTLTPAQIAEVNSAFGGTIAEEIKAEQLDSYEIGIKQSLLDGALRYALVGYWMDWKNQKSAATIFLTADNGRSVGFRVPGESEIKGVEVEVDWAVSERLELSGTLNWTDSKYTDFNLAGNAAFFGGTALSGYNSVGNTQPRFPEFSGTLSLTRSDSINAQWDWFVRGDAIYTGKQYVDELNLAYVDSYTTMNLTLGFQQGDHFSIQAYVSNLFGKEGWATAAGSFDLGLDQVVTLPLQRGAVATPIDRRAIGVRTRYRF
ncbi:MAG: TonB-dependent receptor [Gammaproteobacteria bacterium]|nr:TonB-dependent receptor [Gammaproteobacteria bacterium]